VQPTVFLDVLCVSATFLFTNCVIVFDEVESRNLEAVGVEFAAPTENGLGERMDVEHIVFIEDEGEKEGVFVDNDGASAAEALDDGDFVSSDLLDVEKSFGSS